MEAYFIQVVGYLLAQSWQIAVLTIAVTVATFALRNRSAHIRYLLWLIVLAKCLVPPLFTLPLAILPQIEPTPISPTIEMPAVNPQVVDTAMAGPPGAPQAPVTTESLPMITQAPAKVPIRGCLGLSWMVGAIAFLLFNLLKALRANYWLARTRKALPAELQAGISGSLAAYGFGSLPRIWLVDDISQPFVWGLLRGSIYLPTDFLNVSHPQRQKSILGHELSHVLRLDAAVNLLQVIAQAIFWFHPLVWWANRKIRAEREKCCDEMAIARLNTSPKDYGTAIVETLAIGNKSTRPVPSLAVAGPAKNIEERIKTMLKPGKKFYKRPSLAATTIVLLLAFMTVPTALVLTAGGATRVREDVLVAEKSIASDANVEGTHGPNKAAATKLATARFGDLLRTFQKPNPSPGGAFGYSIAVVGDNVLVGAYSDGAAYLFDGSSGKLLRTFLNPSPAGSMFGWSVAAVGKNVLVGDPIDETNGENSGRAYLFDGATGELLHTFVNPKPDVCKYFGRAVAGVDDRRVIIAAVYDDIGAEGAGAAYLFDASTGRMLQFFQKPKRATFLGMNIACVTGIGENVIVGAPEDDTGAQNAGCVYMFDSSTGKVVRTFLNPTPTADEAFGNFIAAAGNNVLIGAAFDNTGGERAGAAYLFDRATGKLLHTFLNSTPGEVEGGVLGDVFGRCVAIVSNNVLIGASCKDTGTQNAGAAYLFDGTTGKLLHTFVNPDPAVDARFGVSVAALGNDILIGAYSPGKNSVGTVYLFKGMD